MNHRTDYLQLHVTPRYKGDVPDLRGGIGQVVPDLANYWTGAAPFGLPETAGRGE